MILLRGEENCAGTTEHKGVRIELVVLEIQPRNNSGTNLKMEGANRKPANSCADGRDSFHATDDSTGVLACQGRFVTLLGSGWA